MATVLENRVTTLLDTVVRSLLESPNSETLSNYSGSGPLWQQVRFSALLYQWYDDNQNLPAWRFLWDMFDLPGEGNNDGMDALTEILESMGRHVYAAAFEDGRTMGLLQAAEGSGVTR